MRRDLPRGLQAAMIVHAAGESSPGNLPDDTHAVALTCPDEAALRSLAARLTAAGVHHRAIIERGSAWEGQAMAIGLLPCGKEVGRKHLSCLPLLK